MKWKVIFFVILRLVNSATFKVATVLEIIVSAHLTILLFSLYLLPKRVKKSALVITSLFVVEGSYGL